MTRHKRKPTTLPLGVISEGTLRPEDLIPAYLNILDRLRLSQVERKTTQQVHREFFDSLHLGSDLTPYDTDDNAQYWIDNLTEIIEAHCPDYAYFGSTEGDGACFGVWASIEQLEEDSRYDSDYVRKINAGDSWPERGVSYCMSVTDHGNVTLYRRSGNRWIEVWSVV